MEIDAYLQIKGQKQGVIKGDVTQRPELGSIRVNELSYGVLSPRDPASGLPTGKRQHQPVAVVVTTGPQTPLVFNAIVTNENLVDVKIDLYEPTPTGLQALALTIELTNASISDFELSYTSGTPGVLQDRYSFTFQKIVVRWVNGAITGEDDWETPVT
jgi:type VI secretion system secreted protein Hcp